MKAISLHLELVQYEQLRMMLSFVPAIPPCLLSQIEQRKQENLCSLQYVLLVGPFLWVMANTVPTRHKNHPRVFRYFRHLCRIVTRSACETMAPDFQDPTMFLNQGHHLFG